MYITCSTCEMSSHLFRYIIKFASIFFNIIWVIRLQIIIYWTYVDDLSTPSPQYTDAVRHKTKSIYPSS